MALDWRYDKELRARRLCIREICFKVVRVARHARFIVSVFHIEVVAGLEQAGLAVRLGVRRESSLALVADGDVRRSPARQPCADATVVLEREERNGHRIVAAGRIRANPDRLADVHVVDRLAANRAGNLRLLDDRDRSQRGVFADNANVDRVVMI